MAKENQQKSSEPGIAGLPKNWATAVQIIGTFGLAVFLVLYYVLVMQPREAERYEQLRQSVASLEQTIAGQQSLLTREQAEQLENLYILAMANEIADLIAAELQADTTVDALAKKIEDNLIFQTQMLEGLRRKDGGTVSEMLTHKIRNSEISRDLASRAAGQWQNTDRTARVDGCRSALSFAIKRAAMAK